MIDEAQAKGGSQLGSNRIPCLAGQNWLVMIKAVIDLDKNELELGALQVPLQIDHSVHMVIANDKFTSPGWPQVSPPMWMNIRVPFFQQQN